ncbi:uncharacterized protein LOC111251519 [Varroa destructor]|uniref:Uncharacterized protein n=1 Tax=Varroa destructor TaxID=109461 RepID=A0A7M7KI10_VARDE|nr:uncharacterized protein LOC111251519 [Varroa destructor]XP_022663897.1 uncharacterized protein LOC111251519 [Varroa destructor]
MLYQSRTYGSSYMGLIRLLILLGLIGVSVITKEGPRFKPFLADQVSLFLDSNLRDFNVLIDMPSLEPFASVDYILVYCEEKTNPIFTGPRFCVSEILTRKEPHQYIKLNPSEIIYNIALFARYRVGDKAVTTKPINTGSVNLTPCDDSCWDLDYDLEFTRSIQQASWEQKFNEIMFLFFLPDIRDFCPHFPLDPYALDLNYIDTGTYRNYITFRGLRTQYFELVTNDRVESKIFGSIRCSAQTEEYKYYAVPNVSLGSDQKLATLEMIDRPWNYPVVRLGSIR